MQRESEPLYLGVKLDRVLTFRPHMATQTKTRHQEQSTPKAGLHLMGSIRRENTISSRHYIQTEIAKATSYFSQMQIPSHQ